MIGTDSPVINLVTSVVENVVGLYHPWTLSPKVIQILFFSLSCGLQVVADDDDAILIERSEYDDDDILIERSEYDDDDVLI